MKITLIPVFLLLILVGGCSRNTGSFEMVLPSPDSNTILYFNLNNGEPYYLVYYKNEIIIGWSNIGLKTSTTDLTNDLQKCETGQQDEQMRTFPDADQDVTLDAPFNKLEICLESNKYPASGITLVFRCYNNMVRFAVSGFFNEEEKNITDFTNFELQKSNESWYLQTDSTAQPVDALAENVEIGCPANFYKNANFKIKISTAGEIMHKSDCMKALGESHEYQFCTGISEKYKTAENYIYSTQWKVIQIIENDTTY
ncbi:MAG: glycoside hydrolase family 97 N-terminal domain-containing protein [Bacteroidales bacterium]|nr:glycoside hydrolase family 97 N-terminal domain-containing protein [Bacteroidales bacterium]